MADDAPLTIMPADDAAAPEVPPTGDPLREKAAQVLREAAEDDAAPVRRGRGRPRGARDSRKRSRRSTSTRPQATPEPAAPEVPPEPPTEAELRGLANLLSVGWRMVAARLRRRALTPAESLELAAAAHPVAVKYGAGALDKWGAEIGLGLTLWGLWEVTALPAGESLEVPAEMDPDAVAGV